MLAQSLPGATYFFYAVDNELGSETQALGREPLQPTKKTPSPPTKTLW